jgi:hypothetical protein
VTETLDRVAQLQDRIKTTTGFAPKRESYAFSKVTEALDLRLKVIKVKIEEGVSANQDVIVLDEEEEDPEPIKLPSFKRNKRAAPDAEPSTAVTKKSKTRPIPGSSDSEDEDEDQDRGDNQSGRGNGNGKEKTTEKEGDQPDRAKGVVGLMRKWEPASAVCKFGCLFFFFWSS